MSDSINIAVPDIGDFDTVEVIELLVKVGDTVRIASLTQGKAACTAR